MEFIILAVQLGIIILTIAAMWRIFDKAGKPGWAAIVPIYNLVVAIQTVGRPTWWIVLFLLPIVNLIAIIIVNIDLAKSFGKSGGYAVGLILLPFIFMPMLAFSDATYIGPAGEGNPGDQPAAS
jgi:hypothetical protein